MAPYIPLLFTPIPFSEILEIMSIFLLGLVVIIPTIKGGWNEFSDTRMLEVAKASAGYDFCPAHADICTPYFRKFFAFSAFSYFFCPSLNFDIFPFEGWYTLAPVVLVYAVSVTMMITSYFAERSNRKSFIQKKQLQVGADAFSQYRGLTLSY